MRTIAQATEVRAALALGTVKKRMRMCGSPAVPSTSATAREIMSHFPAAPVKYLPGWSRFTGTVLVASPVWTRVAAPSSASNEKPKCAITRAVIAKTVTISRPALMI